MLAAEAAAGARRMRYAPPDLDRDAWLGGGGGGDREVNTESEEMYNQIADRLDEEEGEVSEAAAEAASLAAEAATCSLAGGRSAGGAAAAAWLGPQDIIEEAGRQAGTAGRTQQGGAEPQAQPPPQQQQQQQVPQAVSALTIAGLPTQRLVIAGALHQHVLSAIATLSYVAQQTAPLWRCQKHIGSRC